MKKETSEPTFEASLQRLEKLVSEMESGSMELDALIGAFEEGQALVKACAAKLDAVEKKIEKITDGGGVELLTLE